MLRNNTELRKESNLVETMLGTSEFQDQCGHMDPFDLAFYKFNLGERSSSGLMGDEATFCGLRYEWEMESGDSNG